MDYYKLGSYSWKITTASTDAQTWFDRGLNWVYGFNHEAAIAADRIFLAREGAENFYTLYRCHNFHFMIYGAMFLGQPAPACARGAPRGAGSI